MISTPSISSDNSDKSYIYTNNEPFSHRLKITAKKCIAIVTGTIFSPFIVMGKLASYTHHKSAKEKCASTREKVSLEILNKSLNSKKIPTDLFKNAIKCVKNEKTKKKYQNLTI